MAPARASPQPRSGPALQDVSLRELLTTLAQRLDWLPVRGPSGAQPGVSTVEQSSAKAPVNSALPLGQDEGELRSPWIESKASGRRFRPIRLSELWRYRELAFFLAIRDVKLRYRQTFFGVAWAIIQPVAAAAVFSVVFGHIARVPSDHLPYPAFVLAGMSIWTYFSTALDRAAQSLVEQADLVTKVYFPRLLAPLAAVIPGLVDLPASLAIVGILVATYGLAPGAALIALPLWIIAATVAAAGAGLWLSALNVQYRDVRHALTFLVQVWFFASPVVYSGTEFTGAWRYLFSLNPMFGVIDGLRWSLLGGPAPRVQDFISVLVAVLVLVSGALYFQRVERRFADVV